MAKTTPGEAAAVIVEGLLRNNPRVLIGGDARFMDRLQRWLPIRYWRVLAYLNKGAVAARWRDNRHRSERIHLSFASAAQSPFRLSRLCTGSMSSTCGSIARMPRARGSKPS